MSGKFLRASNAITPPSIISNTTLRRKRLPLCTSHSIYRYFGPVRKARNAGKHFVTETNDVQNDAEPTTVFKGLNIHKVKSGEDWSWLSPLKKEHTTLTVTEKAAFDAIIKRIKPPSTEQRTSDHRDEEVALEGLGESLSLTENLENLFNGVIKTVEKQKKATETSKPSEPPRVEVTLHRDPYLRSFPTSHKKTRAEVLNRPSTTLDLEIDLEHGPEDRSLEAPDEEFPRVSELLAEAQTDVELWQILEEEVFARMKEFLVYLQVEEDTEIPPVSPKTKRKPSQTSLEEFESAVLLPTSEPPPINSLPLLQANYAAHLLTAARIFRMKFPCSTFTTTLLPAIKALGPISYVLGATTELYNELLFIRWVHWRDLHGCADLLEEMLSRSVDTNLYTVAVFQHARMNRRMARNSWLKQAGKDGTEAAVVSGRNAANRSKRNAPRISEVSSAWWSLQGVKSGWARWKNAHHEAASRWQDERQRLAEERERQQLEEDEHRADTEELNDEVAEPGEITTTDGETAAPDLTTGDDEDVEPDVLIVESHESIEPQQTA